jgi:hypothetical protein
MDSICDLPAEVVRPYMDQIYDLFRITVNDHNNSFKYPGLNAMAKATGISDKVFRDVFNGKKQRVSLTVCDRLAIYGDFNLNDMYEDAVDYPGWPEKYQPRGASVR